jgi:MoaA/NifB/PqqE/SkfB family radical SAM enzyme
MQLVRLGTRCNNACVFCAQADERARGSPEPSEAQILAAIEAVPEGEPIALVGGEPTMHAELPKWIRYARGSGGREVVLQTNARRLAYLSYAQELRSAGLSAIDVTLLGSTAPMHDYHTGTPGSFGQTVQGMRHAKACGMRVLVTCVITRSNVRHLADIVRVAHAAGGVAIRLQVPVPAGRAREQMVRLWARRFLLEPHLKLAFAQGRRLHVGVSLAGRADPPFVDFIADGVERLAVRDPRPDPAPASAQPTGRARPAPAEQRVREHRTGADLKQILPDLFSPATEER